MDMVPGKLFNPREEVDADEYVETNAYVGAFHDFECRTTSAQNFELPIYFHPACLQCRRKCRPDLDDDDVENIVGIPAVCNRRMHWDSETRDYQNKYDIEVDLYRPRFTIEEGGQYKSFKRVDAMKFELGAEEDVNIGDTIFVYDQSTKNTTIHEVTNVEIDIDDGDLKTVTVNASLPEENIIGFAGWVMPDEDPNAQTEKVVDLLKEQDRLEPPTFAGVCGPLQPIISDSVLLHFMALLTGNAKVLVDDKFYKDNWLSGDPIELRLLKKQDSSPLYDNENVLDTYSVRYTRPSADLTGVVWRCFLGTFVIEADDPWANAAYVLLAGPQTGVSEVSDV